jgi:hypothetical protein
VLFNGIGKHLLSFLDLHADFGQVRQFHGRSVLVDQGFQIEPIEMQASVLNIETFLGEIESLFHQVGVRVIHELIRIADGKRI